MMVRVMVKMMVIVVVRVMVKVMMMVRVRVINLSLFRRCEACIVLWMHVPVPVEERQ